MYRKHVSEAVRFFLRKWPVTEGKKQTVAFFMDSLVPDVPMQLSMMKDGFYLHLNTSNREHLYMFLYGQHDERYEVKILKKLIKEGRCNLGHWFKYWVLYTAFFKISKEGESCFV